MKKLMIIGGSLACAAALALVLMGTSQGDVCTVESKSKCASQEKICLDKCMPDEKNPATFKQCREKCFQSACACMTSINCECAVSSKDPGN